MGRADPRDRAGQAADWAEAACTLAIQVTGNAIDWHDAVCSTPRHVLVPRWWEMIPDSYPFAWRLVDPELGDWLAAAYSDETLVTQVGTLHADHASRDDRPVGDPTSSSTLPGLIVSMLQLLDPQPGDQILDVGTGSGYSAALLGHRFGDDQVASIDVDAYLVQVARLRLGTFGRTPRIDATDATGPLPGVGYDRILATVSVRPVPRSWLDALRPGGRIVASIAQTSLLIHADMGDDGIVRGKIHAHPASFMRTRQQEADYASRLDDVYGAARDLPGDHIRPLAGPMPDLWTDWSLRHLYELHNPDVEHRTAVLEDGTQLIWLLSRDGSWARAEQSSGVVHQTGRRRLWDDLEHVRDRWDSAGHFPLHEMSVQLKAGGSTVTSPDGSWTMPI